MTSRTWTNGSGLAISAANLNSLETDVQKGIDALSAVGLITINSWQPNTVYALNRYLLDPNGATVKVTTAHTSTSTYDGTKFTAAVAPIGDATVAGFIGDSASVTSAALESRIAGSLRTNWVVNPTFMTGIGALGFQNGTSGVAALSWQPGTGADGVPGFARATWTTASTSGGGINAGGGAGGVIPIPAGSYTAGDSYTFSAYVRSSKAQTITWGTYFRAGTGGSLAGSGQTNFTLTANTWTRVSRTLTVAATADNAYFYLYAATGSGWAINDTLDIDNILVEKSPTLGTYFDGGTTETPTTNNEWAGVPHASRSTQRVSTAALKPFIPRSNAIPVGRGEQWADVSDYLVANRIPGITDDRPAFEAARLTGKRVYAPEGTYYLSLSPAWGDNAFFVGAGKGKTIIKLLDSAPRWISIWDNGTTGSVQGYFADFTIDGNCYRQGGAMEPDGGSRSSGFTIRYGRYITVERVSVVNPLQHGFDATLGSYDYPYLEDGSAPAGTRSSDIHYIECDASNFGDDAFTCHSSDYITYTNCYGFNPRKRENCNAFEIDGDSRYVILNGNRSSGCYGGIEIKGHKEENAARVVQINGHISEGDVRSYNFRHIGHHSGADLVSQSAYDIVATNLISLFSNNDKGFQDEATPRGLVIAAFRRVSIHGLTIIGRGYGYEGQVAIGIQSWSSHISLSGVNISGWGGGDQDISITTGDNISISGVNIQNSSARAIYIGSAITAVQLWGWNATAPTTGALYGIDMYSSGSEAAVQMSGMNFMGYASPVRGSGMNWGSPALWTMRARDVPAGITSMKDVDVAFDYYADTTKFATFTTDRPTGATGGFWIRHSPAAADSTIQTITRNTSGTPVQYWRILNFVAKSSSAWQQATTTAVAYSAT